MTEQDREEFRQRSPLGQVPTLVIDDGGQLESFTQSLAIILRLESIRPEPALVPADPRAKVRAWELAEIINAGIQPHQNLQNMRALSSDGVDAEAWVRRAISRGLTAFSRLSERASGHYSAGDEITIADLCLVPQLYAARRYGVDLDAMSRLTAIDRELAAHPAFQSAHPDNQPDAPASSGGGLRSAR